MEMKGLMGGFYRISEWIMRFAVINVLWLICSLPFVFIAISSLQVNFEEVEDLYPLLVLLGIISPFTLFPATAAMFATARKWVMGEVDVPLFKTFFAGYKHNYKQSMIGGFIFMLLGIILFVNYRFYLSSEGILQYLTFLFIAFFVVLAAAMVNFFSIMVHFHMRMLQVVKNALLLTIGNPFRSVLILASNFAIAWISFTKFTFLIPFFMGSVAAYVSFWHFNGMFQKIVDKQEALRKEEENGGQAEDSGTTKNAQLK